MAKKNLPPLQIIELFLVKSNWRKPFVGEIKREKTKNGSEICRGTVVVNEGRIWSIGESQDELGNNLDALCELKLDYGLHEDAGIFIKISGFEYFLN